MRRVCYRRGLTLMELLVVLLIVTVLIGLLFPVIHSARQAVVRTDCRSHLRQIGMAYQLYVSDWEAYPSPSALTSSPAFSNPRVLFCPDDTTVKTLGAASSYTFIGVVPPTFVPIKGLPEVDPNVVLTRCEHHLLQKVPVGPNDQLHRSAPFHPFEMILRASGSVQEIPISRKRTVKVGRGPWMVELFPGEPGY